MPKDARKESHTDSELREYASELRLRADKLDAAAERFVSEKVPPIKVWSAVDFLGSFSQLDHGIMKVNEAIRQAKLAEQFRRR